MSKKKHKNNNGGSPAPVKASEEKAEESVVLQTAEEEKTVEAPEVNEVIEPVKFEDPAEEKTSKKKKSKKPHEIEITKIQVIGEVKEDAKKTGENIIKALDEALDENAEELDHPESAALQTAKRLSLRRVAVSLFGFFVMIFAVVGIVSTVSFTIDYFERRNDDSLLRQAFLDKITPLAAFDSSTFEEPSVISEDMLITAAGWDIILNPESYTEQNGYYTVSQLDIDKRIASLFGSGLGYTHKTVGDEELSFVYDEKSGMYTVPAFPQSPAYMPKLSGYEATENGYRVEIAYYQPISALIHGNISAEKIMIYTLKNSTSGYIISSLELSELITGNEL